MTIQMLGNCNLEQQFAVIKGKVLYLAKKHKFFFSFLTSDTHRGSSLLPGMFTLSDVLIYQAY